MSPRGFSSRIRSAVKSCRTICRTHWRREHGEQSVVLSDCQSPSPAQGLHAIRTDWGDSVKGPMKLNCFRTNWMRPSDFTQRMTHFRTLERNENENLRINDTACMWSSLTRHVCCPQNPASPRRKAENLSKHSANLNTRPCTLPGSPAERSSRS